MKRTKHAKRALLLLGAYMLAISSTVSQAQDKPVFEPGSTMDKIQKRGTLILGTKYDTPGYSLMDVGTGKIEGLDIEIARAIAKELGLGTDNIEYKEAVSKNRIPFITNDVVDIVIASTAITDERREVIGMAGPYYVAGTQLVVKHENKDRFTNAETMAGAKICATTGGTPIAAAKRFGADAVAFDTYEECVQQLLAGTIDGVLVGGGVAYGYADKYKEQLTVTLEPFDPQRLGVGLKKDDPAFCELIRTAIQKSFESGEWQSAFDATLGAIGAPRSEPPVLDEGC